MRPVVAPARTDGGYRLYDDAAIDRLRAMRILVDDGMSPRQAADQVTAAAPDELTAIVGVGASGTEPAGDAASAIVGFVDAAARIDGRGIARAVDELFASGSFERAIEDRIFPALSALGDAWTRGDVDVAGDPEGRLPHVVTFSCLYVDGEAIVGELDRRGFAVGSGSACTSSALEPSHVLAAMGVLTHGNVRLGLTRTTTEAEVDAFLDVLPGVVGEIRGRLGVA